MKAQALQEALKVGDPLPEINAWPKTIFECDRLIRLFHRARKIIERLQAQHEKTARSYRGATQSSSTFRTPHDAESYYRRLGFNRRDVAAKVAASEIDINPRPPHLIGWDEDYRAIVKHPLSANALEETTRLGALRRKTNWAFDLEAHLKDRRHAISAAIDAKAVEATTKTALDRLLTEFLTAPWPRDLPYCYAGFPYYTAAQFDKEYRKKSNTRAIEIDFQGRRFVLVRARAIKGPSGVCWGMQDGGHHLYLFDNRWRLLTGEISTSKITKKDLKTIILDEVLLTDHQITK